MCVCDNWRSFHENIFANLKIDGETVYNKGSLWLQCLSAYFSIWLWNIDAICVKMMGLQFCTYNMDRHLFGFRSNVFSRTVRNSFLMTLVW